MAGSHLNNHVKVELSAPGAEKSPVSSLCRGRIICIMSGERGTTFLGPGYLPVRCEAHMTPSSSYELGASDVSGHHYKLRDTCLTPSIGQLSRDPDTSVTRTRGLKTKTHNFFINLRAFLSDDANAICQSLFLWLIHFH